MLLVKIREEMLRLERGSCSDSPYTESWVLSVCLKPDLSFPYTVFISCSFENGHLLAIMRIGISRPWTKEASSFPLEGRIVSDRREPIRHDLKENEGN
jgi:hypothetical protein